MDSVLTDAFIFSFMLSKPWVVLAGGAGSLQRRVSRWQSGVVQYRDASLMPFRVQQTTSHDQESTLNT